MATKRRRESRRRESHGDELTCLGPRANIWTKANAMKHTILTALLIAPLTGLPAADTTKLTRPNMLK